MNNKQKYIVIRIDDICKYDSCTFDIINMFLKNNISINLGIIPYNIEIRLVEWLIKQKKLYPSLISLNQHGYKHRNYSNETSVEYEFGQSRNYIEQYNDILLGKYILNGYFQLNVSSVFIPPYNHFNTSTIFACEKLKFKYLSHGMYQYRILTTMKQIFTNIDPVVSYDSNIIDSCENVLNEIKRLSHEYLSITGILLHPNYLGRDPIKWIYKFIRMLKKIKSLKYSLIDSL